jgi:hypothetical protein
MPEQMIYAFVISLLSGLHVILGTGGLGAIILAAAAETTAKSGKTAFMYKFSEQTSKIAAWLLLYLGLGMAAGIWISFRLFPENAWLWMMDWRLDAVLIGIPMLAVLLGLIYKWLFKPLKQKRGLHVFLGILASAAGLCALLVTAMAKMHVLKLSGEELVYPTLAGLLKIQSASPETWVQFAHLAMLAISSGGAVTLLYLLARRNKDDYGRDYYAHTVRFASKWTAVFCVLALPAWGFIAYTLLPGVRVMPDNAPAFGAMAAYTALLIIAAALFTITGRSAMPMRHKPLIIIAAACLWLGIACFMEFLNRVYGIYSGIGIL